MISLLKNPKKVLEKVIPYSYRIFVPLVMFVLMYIGDNFSLQLPEYGLINARFKFRAWLSPWKLNDETGKVEKKNDFIHQKFGWLGDQPADENVVFVKIDETSLKRFGRWPWERKVHGDFIKLLSQEEPDVVAFDILFTEEGQSEGDRRNDLYFGESVNYIPVVTGARRPDVDKKISKPAQGSGSNNLPFKDELIKGDRSKILSAPRAEVPIPQLLEQDRSYYGFIDSPPSSDGIRRKLPLIVQIGNEVFPSLSLKALSIFWQTSIQKIEIELGKEIRIPTKDGIKRIPIDNSGAVLINYRAKDLYKAVDYAALFSNLEKVYVSNTQGDPRVPSVKNKILLIGQSLEGLVDMGPDPMDPISPLVLTHLHVLNSVLKQDFLKPVPIIWVACVWLILSWISITWVQFTSIRASVMIPALMIAFYIAAAFIAFCFNIMLPVFWPVVGFAALHLGDDLIHWTQEHESQQQIKSMFSAHLGPKLLDHLLKNPDTLKLGGERKNVAVMFTDIRNFTTLSEVMAEGELVTKLNEYFQEMVNCVTQNDGRLDKYIGDAVMAVWGDVVAASPEANARNAVDTALKMRIALEGLNEKWNKEKSRTLSIGVGINMGEVVAGYIGATQQKMEYTVIGDNVNLASRLEGVTKEFDTDIVVSESVRQCLDPSFFCRTVGLVQVKGKTKAVRVFEVIGKAPQIPDGWTQSLIDTYEAAFSAYLSRDFQKAIELFEKFLSERGEDYCATTYLEASQGFIKAAPSDDWDGVLRMETK